MNRKQFPGTSATLQVLGQEIKEYRKKRRYSETELALRVGCSRETIRNIEQGKPSVEIGLFFQAGAHVGLILFGTSDELSARIQRIQDLMVRKP